MRQLEGKIVLMIGGGWIATGSVLELARAGARLVIGDLDAEGAERLAAAAREAGGTASSRVVDLADGESLKAAVETVMKTHGRLDGLYLNGADTAGAAQDYDVLATDPQIWERGLRVNLTGYFLAMRAALPAMLAGGGGSIVSMSSDDAFDGGRVRVAYSVSKLGVQALSRHVASRWGRENIRSNVVCPGAVPNHPAVLAALGEAGAAEWMNDYVTRTPSPRLGEPRDIGAAVAFLLSDAAQWINGQVLSVDGGLIMR